MQRKFSELYGLHVYTYVYICVSVSPLSTPVVCVCVCVWRATERYFAAVGKKIVKWKPKDPSQTSVLPIQDLWSKGSRL